MIDTAHKIQTLTDNDCNATEVNTPLASDQNCIIIDTSIASNIDTRIETFIAHKEINECVYCI